MILLPLLSIFIVFLSIVYYLSKRKYDYWEKRCVPFEKPAVLFGNFAEFITLRKFWGEVTQELCKKFNKEPYFGVFYGTEPALVVQDPEIVKLVTTKDFYYFSSRENAEHNHKETITQNIFFTQGDRWKVLRQNLSPLFSSAKMRNMFHLIDKCCKALDLLLEDEAKKTEVDIRTTMVRYTMDCITSCTFGVNSDVMNTTKEASKNPFKIMGETIFECSNLRGLKIVARSIWPSLFYALGFKVFPSDIDKFFNELITGVFQSRNYKPSPRNDFVDLLLNFKENKFLSGDSIVNVNEKSEKKERITLEASDDLLIAACMVFFAAGFETSASTMSFTLFELAKHQEAQKRATAEVDEYLKKTGGKLTFECMTELPYLEACVNETLRLYPILGVVTREVVDDYTLPTGLVLQKGLRIHLPVYHLHHNAEYFPEPQKYRPERFFGEEKSNIVSYTYMPFGDGPRSCMGMRFAKMQMMAGLVTLLRKYSLQLADDMPHSVPFEPRTFVTQAIVPVRMSLIPRPDC